MSSSSDINNITSPGRTTLKSTLPSVVLPAQDFVHNLKERWDSVNVNPRQPFSKKLEAAYSFRRFSTMHHLNLRFLENEILTLEQQFIEAGLVLSKATDGIIDIDPRLSNHEGNISTAFVGDLRRLVHQYGK
jgi:hypothetical protein